jgi:branched-chain amino acid transport system substrate-binding protein
MAVALLAASLPPAAQAAAPIKIGLVSVFDFVQEWITKGAQFAVDDINASGGVLGRRLELIAVHDPALGDRGTRRLLQQDRVDALIGPEVWTATQNNDQAIRERRVINMLPLSPAGDVNALRNPYVFRLVPSDAAQAEALVRHLVDERGLSKIAVIYADDFLGRAGAGLVRDRLRFAGRHPVFESSFNMGQVDFTTLLGQAQRSHADALIVWGLAREAARIAVTARNLGWNVQIAGPVEAVFGDYVELAGKAAEGTLSVLPHKTINNWAPPGSDRANWFARYHRRFVIRAIRGTQVPNLPVAQAVVYDSVQLIADAMRLAGSTDGEKVRRVLESGHVFKLETHDFRFTPADHETYPAGDLWAFRLASGAVNFDIDPRADKRKETEAWQLFAAGLLFNRKTGTAFIPYSIGTFDQGRVVPVGPFRWQAVSVRFVDQIAVEGFGLPPRIPDGKYAIVHLRITNSSRTARKAPWTFAIDQDGNLSLPDPGGMAALWVNGGPDARFFIFTPLAPGASLDGDFVFDVAKMANALQVGVPDDFIFQNYAMVRMRPA